MSMKWKSITFLLLLVGFSSNAYANYTIYPFCSGSVFPSDPSRDHSLLHGCLAAEGITYSRYASSNAFYGVRDGSERRFTFSVSGGRVLLVNSPIQIRMPVKSLSLVKRVISGMK